MFKNFPTARAAVFVANDLCGKHRVVECMSLESFRKDGKVCRIQGLRPSVLLYLTPTHALLTWTCCRCFIFASCLRGEREQIVSWTHKRSPPS